jgi:hypothetical protein
MFVLLISQALIFVERVNRIREARIQQATEKYRPSNNKSARSIGETLVWYGVVAMMLTGMMPLRVSPPPSLSLTTLEAAALF